MNDNFDIAFDYVIAHEAGYVNHPKDPGGPTNKGVTQRTLSAWLGRPATIADVKGLTTDTVRAIYRKNYWNPARCDSLPVGLDYAVFDTAINSGVSQSVKLLQRALGFSSRQQDGIVGVQTLDAIAKYPGGTVPLIERYCEVRMAFLEGLKNWPSFKKGWTRRVVGYHEGVQADDSGVVDRAVVMARGKPLLPNPKTLDDGASAKAFVGNEAILTILKEPGVFGAIGGVISAVLAAGAGDGPIAYALSAVLVIVTLAVIYLTARK